MKCLGNREFWERGRLENFAPRHGCNIVSSRISYGLLKFRVGQWRIQRNSRPPPSRLSRVSIATRNFSFFLRKKIEVLKRDGKHRLYTYITRCTRVLEDWWGMVDSEQDVNRIIVRRTREKKMYTDIKSVLSSCSYLTEIGIHSFRYRSTMLLIKNCVSIFRSKFLNVFSRNVYL